MHLQARPWLTILVGLGLVISLASTLQAEDKPAAAKPKDQKVFDKKMYEVLRTVINTGADLYNRDGDRAGCYRLYQGSLLTIRPLLEPYPDLQKEIDAALASVDSQASVGARAHTLRKVLGKIRDTLKPPTAGGEPPPKPPVPKPAEPAPPTTLWDRLGGEAKVQKVVDDFVALVAKDAKVDFDRSGKFKLDAAAIDQLKKELVAFVSQATGGPFKYTGKSMKEAHKGMGITSDAFNYLVEDLATTLGKLKVGPNEQNELIGLLAPMKADIVEK